MTQCKLKNLYTGETVTAFSQTEFCKKVGLAKESTSAIPMINQVCNGKKLHYKGWCLPANATKRFKIKDIYGNVISGTLTDFIKQNIPICRVWTLANEKKSIVNGFSLADTETNTLPPTPYRVTKYKFLTPNNKVVCGSTLVGISRQLQ